MGLFFIHPPQEYLKKSTQGSMLRSIEVTSSAGSCFACGVDDCWAADRDARDAIKSAIARTRESDMSIPSSVLPAENTGGGQIHVARDECRMKITVFQEQFEKRACAPFDKRKSLADPRLRSSQFSRGLRGKPVRRRQAGGECLHIASSPTRWPWLRCRQAAAVRGSLCRCWPISVERPATSAATTRQLQ